MTAVNVPHSIEPDKPEPHAQEPQWNEEFLDSRYLHFLPYTQNIPRSELSLGLFAVSLWVIFFSLGLLLPTEAMREDLWGNADLGFLDRIGFMLLVGMGYTLTNVLFLSTTASLLGSMAHRWQFESGADQQMLGRGSFAATRVYTSAVLRGFFVYLMFLSGFLVVSTEQSVVHTELSQYVRVAGFISIISFFIGYDPDLLVRFMKRLMSLSNLSETEPKNVQGVNKPK